MNRNIFRGKRIDNGKWAIGYLIKGTRTYIATRDAVGYMVVSANHSASLELVEVAPDTVCQSLDKFDITGRDMFENDFVSFERFSDEYIGRIVFNPKTCGFEIWYNTVVGGYGETATHKINFSNIEKIKVVGNIFD